MIVSTLECKAHGRLGIVKLNTPGVRPNGDWVYSGPWHAVFDIGGEMSGFGCPEVPCVADPECTADVDFWHMTP